MYQDYRIDERKLRAAVAAKGFSSFAELLKTAALHRNSLNDYMDGRRSVFSAVTRKICGVLDCDPLALLSRHERIFLADKTGQVLRELLERISQSNSEVSFFLLGSRAKGTQRDLSDWDVAVSAGRSKLPTDEYLRIKSAVEDGVENFPVEVDVINFDQAPQQFLADIDYEPVFLAGNESSFSYALGVIYGARKN